MRDRRGVSIMHGDADSEQVVVTGWTVPNDRATEVVRESLRRGSTLAEAVLSRGIQVTAAHLCASEAQIDRDIPIVDIDRGYGVPYDRSIGAARPAQLASQSVATVIDDTLAGSGDPVLDPPAGIIGPLYHDDRILWGGALETADDAIRSGVIRPTRTCTAGTRPTSANGALPSTGSDGVWYGAGPYWIRWRY